MRTVKVGLEADVADYLAGIMEAEKATDKLDDKVEALDHDLDKLKKDSVEAAAGLDTVAVASREAGEKIDGYSEKLNETATQTAKAVDQTGQFDKRIAELKTSIRDLGAEFDRTGDPELLKKFRADSSELRGLQKMRTEVEKLGDDLKSGPLSNLKGGGEGLGSAVDGGLTSPLALGLMGAAAGPLLAAAGGALGGLAGAGGAGLGVYGAVLGNPQAFQSAWTSATTTVKSELVSAGAAFTGPALAAIASIGPTIQGWHLDQALAPAAKYVPVLTKGLEGFATGVEHGFAALVDHAGPEVQALSNGAVQLGDAFGMAFSDIASGAEGGAQAMGDLISAVSLTVEAIGKITQASEKSFSFIHDHPIESALATGGLSLGVTGWNLLADATKKGGDATEQAGKQAAAAEPDFAKLSKTLNETTVDADSLAEKMSTKVLSSMMGLDQATLHFDEALLKVGESVKANGHSLDEHSAKGLANRQMILSLVQANIAEYQANINAGAGAEFAAKAYDTGTAALEKQLRQAGFTQTAIDGLIGKYRGVPTRVDTNIALEGLTNAINDLDDLIRRLNGLPARKDITIYTHTGTAGGKESGPQYSGGAQAPPTPVHNPQPHAAGGMLDPGWNLLGEQGPELEYNGRVYTAADTRAMLAPTWSGGGSGVTRMTLDVAPGANLTPLGSLLNQMLRDGIVVVKASQVRAGV